MKIFKLLSLASLFVIALSSCSKNDIETAGMPEVPAMNLSSWKPIAAWETSPADSSSLTGRIQDNQITAAVADGGMVLVFKNDGSQVASLPLTENGRAWTYQVTAGGVDVYVDGSTSPAASNTFQYVIFNASQLKDLEQQQVTKSSLLDMSYEQVSNLIAAK